MSWLHNRHRYAELVHLNSQCIRKCFDSKLRHGIRCGEWWHKQAFDRGDVDNSTWIQQQNIYETSNLERGKLQSFNYFNQLHYSFQVPSYTALLTAVCFNFSPYFVDSHIPVRCKPEPNWNLLTDCFRIEYVYFGQSCTERLSYEYRKFIYAHTTLSACRLLLNDQNELI